MSNAIFPTLAGFGPQLTREPFVEGTIQTSVSGRELSYTWMSAPRYRYKLSLDGARSDATNLELQQILRFFTSRLGPFDTFLLQDPEDNAVTAHGFGVGNASTLAFQLQRTLGGGAYDSLGGPWGTSSTPRTNQCLYSQAMGTGWSPQTGVSVTSNYAIAPDGTTTASRIVYNGTGTTGSYRLYINATPAFSAGVVVVLSVWMRSNTPRAIALYANYGPVKPFSVTTTWQRFSYSVAWDGASTPQFTLYSPVGDNTAWDIQAWGAQVEAAADASLLPSSYIATTSAAVTATPNYWPTSGDGFEPIYCPAVGPSIYVAGALKTLTSDYSISNGLVTFTSAPASGAALTWTGGYYWRVRFDPKNLTLDRIVPQLWRAGQIQLVTVPG